MLVDIDGLVQDCSDSIADALELLQSCTKPLICFHKYIQLAKGDVLDVWYIAVSFFLSSSESLPGARAPMCAVYVL